ncbi:hypothetical protein BI308_13595 [Roseofilum reptotaenium AO1-A]|uniref:Uncharacterized protein n=1 Tax=Roseofilum reptotaenium AO1-A TaxID=1925591 RepID=A0A1L9QQX6_9CYAN|nr:hypothetical protein [Roseofilum reptotaenium]OJJ25081.1 hypothetical protein BI308_13595 [Roseofilum reptotaenium AO1-A]
MVSSFRQADDSLPRVDYGEMLDRIVEAIANQPGLFRVSDDSERLLVNVEAIAHRIAQQNLDDPILGSDRGIRAATLNSSPSCAAQFPDKIRNIRQALLEQLQSSLRAKNLETSAFLSSLVQDFSTFQNSQPSLDLSYPFTAYTGLQKERLQIQSPGSIKFHKLTITVDRTDTLNRNLPEELRRYIQEHLDTETDEQQADLEDVLTDLIQDEHKDSDINLIKRLMDTEVLGQLKKEAKIQYLEYLEQNINADRHPEVVYLQDLIRRLKALNDYIADPQRSDADYEVTYQGTPVNFRQLFSRAEAFDILPVIPIIEGYLGETTDPRRNRRQFIFGLKLKLNGPVQNQGSASAFDYYCSLLDLDREENQAVARSPYGLQKILKVAFLYFFVFASDCDPEAEGYNHNNELHYDPVSRFEAKILPTLQGDNDEAKVSLLRGIRRGLDKLKAREKVNRLVKLVKHTLTREMVIPPSEHCIHVGVRKTLLETDVDTIFGRQTLFREALKGNPKQCLQYLSVGEATVNPEILCQLPVSIKIEDIRYSETSDRQTFSMSYKLDHLQSFPVLLMPKQGLTDKVHKKHYETLQRRKLVLFHIDTAQNEQLDDQQAFLYRFTFSLLFYIVVQQLARYLPNRKNLFIPIVRFHLTNKNNSSALEEFILNLSVTVSHLLNEEEILANFQGFDITSNNIHKTRNGLSSLYSRLPKVFSFDQLEETPQLEKLAIIVVSSRESDAHYQTDKDRHLSNLMGEVVSVTRREDARIEINCLSTFSDSYLRSEMFNTPLVLRDKIVELYQRGYRHFVYIAKAPYTSSLNITAEEDRLFFMSRSLIRCLVENNPDIKIYPMFFDKYYVRSSMSLKPKSLYVQDIRELTQLVDDPSQQSVVFFNLFNGLKVGKKDERFYNGVISYATLLNTYKGILDNEVIYQGLLHEGDLKHDILQYLTLFHFSRYEAMSKISLKLDPYQNIIGDYSVGKLSLFKHMNGKSDFNSLAFLTEVKKALI